MFKNKEEILKILKFQYKYIFPTPQIYWPKIYKRFGNKVWVKHENHTIIGSFKIRSSLNQIKNESKLNSVFCCASNGNYGQGIAFACSSLKKKAIIFCPIKTSKNKINSIISLGGKVYLEGIDFTETYEIAKSYAKKNNYKLLQSYNTSLVKGCSTYSYELFKKIDKLNKVYVPIGLGSGICGTIYTRNLLNLKTDIVGVVPKGANSYSLSFKNKNLTAVNKVNTFAEGTAVRIPNQDALDLIYKNVSDVVEIEEDNIKSAIKDIYDDTGNISEGSGALSYAAAFKDRKVNKYKNIGIILTGGNIDRKLYSKILSN